MQDAEATLASDHADDLDLLLTRAREAGEIALRYFRKSPEVWMKTGDSPVSEADYAVDRYLRETLMRARPDYGWLSEETADTPDRLAVRRTFVVDPIDGTRAFLDGRSTWCVSVAVVERGRALAGVLDCPARGEIFSAVPGRGAVRNGVAIQVRRPPRDPQIGGPKPLLTAAGNALRQSLRPVSYIPSLAYRVAMIAAGELDASFVRPNSHDWDLAAADLILAEAGGAILNQHGARPLYAASSSPRHGVLVAGSGPLLEKLARVIAAAV